jgi:hypothetical protein
MFAAAAAGVGILLLLVVTCYFWWRRRRQNSAPSNEEMEVVQKKGFSFWTSKSKKDNKVDGDDEKDTTHFLEISFQGTSEEDLEKGTSSDPDSSSDMSSDSEEEDEEPKSSKNGNVVYNSKTAIKRVHQRRHCITIKTRPRLESQQRNPTPNRHLKPISGKNVRP